MEQNESIFFDEKTSKKILSSGFGNPIPLRTSAQSQLFRLSREGKHFLAKTTKDNSQRGLDMLRREFNLSIGCDHPHLVHCYIFEEESPVGPAIIMEYVEGRTLGEWLAESPTLAARQRVFGELLDVVGYLHKRGIIHNDIKPENILITRSNDTLKLIDLGLSDNDAHYGLQRLGCTPRYASPELLTRSNKIDSRSDIYSVGVIMGELFGAKYRRIARRALNPLPEQRYADIDSFTGAWHRRNRPLQISLIGVALLAILIPIVVLSVENSTIKEQQQHSKETIASLERQLDETQTLKEREQEVIATIESQLQSLYEQMICDIEKAPYWEPNSGKMVQFRNSALQITKELIETIDDKGIENIATSTVTTLVDDYMWKIHQKVFSLPSITDDGLSPEEQQSYIELLKTYNYNPTLK